MSLTPVYAAEIALSEPPQRLGLTLPLRIDGLHPRGSAGLLLRKGYFERDYGPGANRFHQFIQDRQHPQPVRFPWRSLAKP